jgi:aspartokinase-like uncharacterized kinase
VTAEKLYLVGRVDLPPAQQAVQMAHAARAYADRHPELEQAWFTTSNTLAMLTVADEAELRALALRADVEGIPFATFHEPDLAGQLTALALSHRALRLVRHLPRALGGR